ncbi:MAG: TMEM165/GDT1 family protein [Pseudomonadota bacterium]|nr:TMEM165/GDT1 family protein [Pseudomonadota bacterium]
MAALVAAIAVLATDRIPWLSAILADRYRKPGIVLAAATLALAINYAIGAAGGALIARYLTPEAQNLFLALGLISAGSTSLGKIKPPERLDGWRIGAFPTAFLGLLILALGDRMQFIVAALALRSPAPALAAIGALIGSLVIIVPATLLGEAARRRVPFRAIRYVTGALLVTVGIVLGLRGLRLI